MSAVDLVAGGGAPSTMVVGLRLTDAVIDIVAADRRGARRRPRAPVGVRRGRPPTSASVGEGPRDDGRRRTSFSSRTTSTLGGLLSAHLQAHGYRVTVAPTAEAASVTPGQGSAPGPRPARHQPAGRDRLVRSCAATNSRPPGAHRSSSRARWPSVPARLREFGVAGLPAQAIRAGHASDHARPPARQRGNGRMTDLQIALIVIACIVVFSGYVLLCERVGR